MKVLITCPPMIGLKHEFIGRFEEKGIEVFIPEFTQIVPETELIEIVPGFDGWIIGDDQATRAVVEAGSRGRLKAAVKWGIGVDNIDFAAFKECGVAITNTPNMFGKEVADLAYAYVVSLARELFFIDTKIKDNLWPKNRGISLAGKVAGVIGFGDIGRNVVKRLLVSDLEVYVYDPFVQPETIQQEGATVCSWPDNIADCDFLVFTCSLTESSHHMFNAQTMQECRDGVRVVNVARGPLINETDLVNALDSGKVHSVALDVFEEEPLPSDSRLRGFPLSVFGSHNGSNTYEAVSRVNNEAIRKLFDFLNL